MEDFFNTPNIAYYRNKNNITSKIADIPSNYVGSKRRMLSFILDFLDKNNVKFDSVFDAFSGSGIVSLFFNEIGKRVISNDILTSSAITAFSLLNGLPLNISEKTIKFILQNKAQNKNQFVLKNYLNKFFSVKECEFLDEFRTNLISLLEQNKYDFYGVIEIFNKAILASIPNSNFSIYGKDLKSLRNTHDLEKSFWDEKWRDTTRKRRDENNDIVFEKAIIEFYKKFNSSSLKTTTETQPDIFQYKDKNFYPLAKILLGQNPAPINVDSINSLKTCVINSDIIELLDSETVKTDLIYLDPPYGTASSDYFLLYSFLEEYLYADKQISHLLAGKKRFLKTKNYQLEFENLLHKSKQFPLCLISYNSSSFASIDSIVSIIKNSGRTSIIIGDVPITYKYRKGKNHVDLENFKENYLENGHKFTGRGTEYLILAKK